MTSNSHYQFGSYLLSEEFYGISKMEQTAFLLGCVEPDWNPGTYLRGSLHCHRFHGHDFLNMLPFLKRFFHKFEQEKKTGLLYFYRLGKLTHYLTDAFTYPHNPAFSGSMKDHQRYESELEPMFLKCLAEKKFIIKKDESEDPFSQFLQAHFSYMNDKAGKQQDIAFTLGTVPCIVHALYSKVLSASFFPAEQVIFQQDSVRI